LTSIDFYFNAEDRLQIACRLAGKAVARGKRLVIYAPEADTASRIDRMLWTWPATGFVPHCMAHDGLAAETPVLIAADEEAPDGCALLLNLGQAAPPHFARFERLLELVGRSDEEKGAGRERFKFYRDRGYAITHHDLAKAPGDG
jgi:DNA polymerase-3 subunit chi